MAKDIVKSGAEAKDPTSDVRYNENTKLYEMNGSPIKNEMIIDFKTLKLSTVQTKQLYISVLLSKMQEGGGVGRLVGPYSFYVRFNNLSIDGKLDYTNVLKDITDLCDTRLRFQFYFTDGNVLDKESRLGTVLIDLPTIHNQKTHQFKCPLKDNNGIVIDGTEFSFDVRFQYENTLGRARSELSLRHNSPLFEEADAMIGLLHIMLML